MKKSNIIVFTILLFLFSLTNVYADVSLSVGTDFGGNGPNSSNDATVVNSFMEEMGYKAILNTKPTKSSLSRDRQIYNLTLKFPKHLFLLGHGSSSTIEWNYNNLGGDYAVGFTTGNSYCSSDKYDYTSINTIDLKNTILAVFMGCFTSQNKTNNLPKEAVRLGAQTALGWDDEIFDGDTDNWSKRFYTQLKAGKTVKQAISYANSFNYIDNTSIKGVDVYGISNTILNSSKSNITMNNNEFIKSKIYNLDANQIKTKTDLNYSNYIKLAYNPGFDPKDYIIEITENSDEIIIDYSLKFQDAKSNIGYTIKVQNNYIEVIDNMNEYSPADASFNILNSNNSASNRFDEQQAIQDALDKNKGGNSLYVISYHSSLKRYDVKTGKMYFDVHLREKNIYTGATAIITETFVMS